MVIPGSSCCKSVAYLTKDRDNQGIPNGEPFITYTKLPVQASDKKNLKKHKQIWFGNKDYSNNIRTSKHRRGPVSIPAQNLKLLSQGKFSAMELPSKTNCTAQYPTRMQQM